MRRGVVILVFKGPDSLPGSRIMAAEGGGSLAGEEVGEEVEEEET